MPVGCSKLGLRLCERDAKLFYVHPLAEAQHLLPIRVPLGLNHKSAYVSIRQHTSAYVSIRQHFLQMRVPLGPNQLSSQHLYFCTSIASKLRTLSHLAFSQRFKQREYLYFCTSKQVFVRLYQ